MPTKEGQNSIFEEQKNKKEDETSIYYNDSNSIKTINDKYVTNRKIHGRQGQGFAAEEANNLFDEIKGKKVDEILGNSFEKNGPDRKVDGCMIQTKYCKTPTACIDACFDKDGKFRYEGMKIEVPRKFATDDAWNRYLEKRGWKNRKELKKEDYIVEGSVSYDTAMKIAKPQKNFGYLMVSSGYDALYGLIENKFFKGAGISSTFAFLQNIWRGRSLKDSIGAALCIALKNTGSTALASMYAGGFAKLGGHVFLDRVQKFGAKKVGSKIAKTILRRASDISLAGEVFAASAIITVETITDVGKIFLRHISLQQFIKNTAYNVVETTAGTIGGIGGTALGTAIPFPIPLKGLASREAGTIVVEKLVGTASKVALDTIIEDDDVRMIRIIEDEYCRIANENLINEIESEEIIEAIAQKITPGLIRQMLMSKDKTLYADTLIMPHVENVIKKRKTISPPSEKQEIEVITEVINEAIESIENDGEVLIEYKHSKTNEFGEETCPHCGANIYGIGYSICKYCDSLVEMPS